MIFRGILYISCAPLLRKFQRQSYNICAPSVSAHAHNATFIIWIFEHCHGHTAVTRKYFKNKNCKKNMKTCRNCIHTCINTYFISFVAVYNSYILLSSGQYNITHMWNNVSVDLYLRS